MPSIQKALKLYYCSYNAKKLTLRHWSRRSLETGIVCVHMHGDQRSTTDVVLICSQKCLFIEPRVHRLNQPVKPVSFRNLPFSSYSHNAVLELQMLAAVCVQFCVHTMNLSLVPHAYKASTLQTSLSPGSPH